MLAFRQRFDIYVVSTVQSVKTERTDKLNRGSKLVPGSKGNDISAFVERFGLMWERLGANRSVGRALAWLTVCDPPEQTADDIRKALRLSQASVSTAVRALEAIGLAERISIPGERRLHYRIPKGAWQTTTRSRLREFDDFIDAAELGRHALEDGPDANRTRIEELFEWATWWRQRYGDLVEEWEKR